MEIVNRPITCVAGLSEDLEFVSDSQDVEAVREHVGPIASDYDAFFVRVSEGDYSEVWGIVGLVPYLSKLTSRLV